MTDVFETHDREQFEIYAYYCGIKRTDPTQARIKASVDGWCEINGLSDQQAARKIAEDQIDILIDVNGYTKDARTKVFALRPAPIAVNWFGFPGTMGSPYHHYIIADPFIIPEGQELYYSEKVLRLPCYQPNDRRRPVAQRPRARTRGCPTMPSSTAASTACRRSRQPCSRRGCAFWRKFQTACSGCSAARRRPTRACTSSPRSMA